MDKALYIAMTGAKHNMRSQTVHSNNLANVNTTGFKSDFAQARSMPVYYGEGLPTRAYALSENPATNFNSGASVETGRDLDIMVERDGFIAVQAPDGQEAFTRAGSLYVDSVGMLRNGSGLPVIGNGGPIAIPTAAKIEIGLDGTISIVPLGEEDQALAQVDRIKLVNPPLEDMRKGEDGLFRPANAGGEVPADANVRIVSGFLEASNVNAVNEMTSVMSLARQYEMQVKIMKTAEQNSESSARLLQSN
ncbi:flagellar basal body rod protein FlgF [Teredinibacter sp. KSP-S5-2]|uniref:flagellar basal body rod protein FlgF n=1 Tax=Teredinibacter sp. KSP-S5-2 TaxID=3034506 RepID=UPI002934F9FC|nr:flagellar basal body rod protein FlgF [Teredinibacter sp. KSP-S5-2]WNO07969.1 flagellar basal body rod protein FlgF [Teredinibacter sp. KSP-S5-2]